MTAEKEREEERSSREKESGSAAAAKELLSERSGRAAPMKAATTEDGGEKRCAKTKEVSDGNFVSGVFPASETFFAERLTEENFTEEDPAVGYGSVGEKTAAGAPAGLSAAEGAAENPAVHEEQAAAGREDSAEEREKDLEEALAFALLYTPRPGRGRASEKAIFRRFCELRRLGLSVREAFSVADCAGGDGKEEFPTESLSKSHLTSSVPKAYDRGPRLAGEELRIARELLGDSYSGEELVRLYRRVTKEAY